MSYIKKKNTITNNKLTLQHIIMLANRREKRNLSKKKICLQAIKRKNNQSIKNKKNTFFLYNLVCVLYMFRGLFGNC